MGKRCSQYIPLFNETSIGQDTELVPGVFDLQLKEYLLDLVNKYTTKWESLLMLR